MTGSKRDSECSKEEEMEHRWVGLREGATQSEEMRQCDEERKVSGRRKGWMEPVQTSSLKAGGEDEEWWITILKGPVKHSMMDHDVSL